MKPLTIAMLVQGFIVAVLFGWQVSVVINIILAVLIVRHERKRQLIDAMARINELTTTTANIHRAINAARQTELNVINNNRGNS